VACLLGGGKFSTQPIVYIPSWDKRKGKLKKTDLAYTAGIIDGEGWISLGRNGGAKGDKSISLIVGVENTNEWLIRWLYFAFGGNFHPVRNRTPQRQPIWKWSLSAKKASAFLKLVYPYLNIKKPQADIAFMFQERKTKRQCRRLSEEDRAVEEAQRILLINMHKGK